MSDRGAPRVSVIIPVKNRRELLGAALDGLAAQTYTDFEVIVVDDGSTDGSGDAAAAREVAGRPVQVFRGHGEGAVAARTLGVEHAAGDVLAFTDSDCVPDREWLRNGMARIDAGAAVVNGLTRPARPTLPLERTMASGLEGLYPTCNMFYRRDAFDRVGGFDSEVAHRWGFRPDQRTRGDGFGEDTLLAWRLIRDGAPVAYAEDAIVEHAVFPPDLIETLSRTVRVAAFPAMVRDIPELRDTLLRWRWQLGPRTRLPVYAFLAAIFLRRNRLALFAFGWWAGVRMNELRRAPVPWPRRWALLPAEMAIDATTAGALLAGSVRSRSVTL